jgi:thiamine pyrophosphate-dependent acetolactate synthase large subunit-like protein
VGKQRTGCWDLTSNATTICRCRFDDRVTGKLEAFAQRARIVHIDIDAAEINKNKTAHVPVSAWACADVRLL